MANVCVITGGGSGMGFEAAKLLDKDLKVVISGRTESKLAGAVDELKECGVDAYAYACDVSDRASVEALAEFAKSLGPITKVIHAAGVSQQMADAPAIAAINAGGTVNVNEVFGEAMEDGGVILNISSMSAYMLPADRIPTQLYGAAFAGVDALLGGFSQMLSQIPEEVRKGTAYAISKNFVVWYTKRMAMKLGKRGIRVASLAPGTFMTPLGKMEGEGGAKYAYAGALGRTGEPVEIGRMMAFIVSDECSYLTGVDVLYDGGAIAAIETAADSK